VSCHILCPTGSRPALTCRSGKSATEACHSLNCRSTSGRRASTRCHMVKSAYCIGSGGRRAADPPASSRYNSPRSESRTRRDHPSAASRCTAMISRCRSRSRRTATRRNNGPSLTSNGVSSTCRIWRRTNGCAGLAPAPGASISSTGAGPGQRMTCVRGPPGRGAGKTVRSGSCRATSLSAARRSASPSSGPSMAKHRPVFMATAPGGPPIPRRMSCWAETGKVPTTLVPMGSSECLRPGDRVRHVRDLYLVVQRRADGTARARHRASRQVRRRTPGTRWSPRPRSGH
jgi:hypothetical protein